MSGDEEMSMGEYEEAYGADAPEPPPSPDRLRAAREALVAAAFGPAQQQTSAKVLDPILEDKLNKGLGLLGNTYNARDALKKIGCRWYAARRIWVAMTPGMFAAADLACKQVGIQVRPSSVTSGSPMTPSLQGVPTTREATLRCYSDGELVEEMKRRGYDVVDAGGESLAASLAMKIDLPTIDELFASFDSSGEEEW